MHCCVRGQSRIRSVDLAEFNDSLSAERPPVNAFRPSNSDRQTNKPTLQLQTAASEWKRVTVIAPVWDNQIIVGHYVVFRNAL